MSEENKNMPRKPCQCAVSRKGVCVMNTTINWWWILLVILILVVYFKWDEMAKMINDAVCKSPPKGSTLDLAKAMPAVTVNTPTFVQKLQKDMGMNRR